MTTAKEMQSQEVRRKEVAQLVLSATDFSTCSNCGSTPDRHEQDGDKPWSPVYCLDCGEHVLEWHD